MAVPTSGAAVLVLRPLLDAERFQLGLPPGPHMTNILAGQSENTTFVGYATSRRVSMRPE